MALETALSKSNWIHISAIHGRKSTIVEVRLMDQDGVDLTFTGEALVHPDDKFDAQVGYELALGRALQAAGNRLTKRANNRLEMIIHNKEHSRRAKKEKRLVKKLPTVVFRRKDS